VRGEEVKGRAKGFGLREKKNRPLRSQSNRGDSIRKLTRGLKERGMHLVVDVSGGTIQWTFPAFFRDGKKKS